MTADAWEELRLQLHAAPPPGLSALESNQLRALAVAVHEAKRQQAAALAAAGDQALAHIPRLFRGPVRKIMG